MQDYFKYDKLQQGSSLFMRSDIVNRDGVFSSGVMTNFPLGIRTPSQAIKHFTNWDSISNSLDSRDSARFDDIQPNQINYRTKYERGSMVEWGGDLDNTSLPVPSHSFAKDTISSQRSHTFNFSEGWDAEDIKIVDDIAFVSYPEYTDLDRRDVVLLKDDFINQTVELEASMQMSSYGAPVSPSPLPQAERASRAWRTGAASAEGLGDFTAKRLGGMKFVTDLIPQDKIFASTSNSSLSFLPLRFAGFDNTILKVEFAGEIGGESVDVPRVLYFKYGGANRNWYEISGQKPVSDSHCAPSLEYDDYASQTNSVFTHTKESWVGPVIGDESQRRPYFNKLDYGDSAPTLLGAQDRLVGNFYVSPHVEQTYNTTIEEDQDLIGPTSQYKTHQGPPKISIELDLACSYKDQGLDLAPTNTLAMLEEWWSNAGTTPAGEKYQSLNNLAVKIKQVTLIKLQPVRKCGKVDVYTRKKGIMTAVTENRVTSPTHRLNTNDIIDIQSAIFDGTQNSWADIHPMNGQKFVKSIDADTFDLYDDEFFENPTDTSKLKSSDGITWICVTNNFGTLGQSWDYYSTIYSPTGRNGYLSLEVDSSTGLGNPETVSSTVPTLSNSQTFVDSKRIKPISLTAGKTNQSRGSIDIDLCGDPVWQGLDSEYAKRIDDCIPTKFSGYISPFTNPNRAPQDFYPYFCQEKMTGDHQTFDHPDNNSLSYFTQRSLNDVCQKSPYMGTRFGCDLDVKFSHMSGASRVYTLVVGERGSDVSVDIFGVESSETDVDNDGSTEIPLTPVKNRGDILKSTFRHRVSPYHLPTGKAHVISITVDAYNNITSIDHKNTLLGGGSAFVSEADSFEEPNPWDGAWSGIIAGGTSAYKPSYEDYVLSKDSIKPVYLSRGDDSSAMGEHDYFKDLRSQYSTTYWIRSSILHWEPHNIHDYFHNFSVEDFGNISLPTLYPDTAFSPIVYENKKSLIEISQSYQRFYGGSYNRKMTVESSDGSSIFSRFGENPITGSATYPQIDRFSENSPQWYIFPWVDSFGKSVALDETLGDDGRFMVLGSSRSRNSVEWGALAVNTADQQQPAKPDVDFSTHWNISEFGSITAHFLDYNNSYNKESFSFLNSSGSDNKSLLKSDGGVKYRDLPVGTVAGKGADKIVHSAEMSANTLMCKDDMIIWGDQVVSEKDGNTGRFVDGQYSIINILERVYNDVIKPSDTIRNDFLVGSKGWWGDGFGMDIRYSDGLIVTNSLGTKTEIGDDIYRSLYKTEVLSKRFISTNVDSGTMGAALTAPQGGSDRVPPDDFVKMDFLRIYKRKKNNVGVVSFAYQDSISPTISDGYEEALLSGFGDYLFEGLSNFTYNNTLEHSATWNIRLAGRYDTTDEKIILKDPLEYSLFGRDYSAESDSPLLVSERQEEDINPYLYFVEKFIADSKIEASNSSSTTNDLIRYPSIVRYDYSTMNSVVVKDEVLPNSSRLIANTDTPVFFIPITKDQLSNIEELKIEIVVDKGASEISLYNKDSARNIYITGDDYDPPTGSQINHEVSFPRLVLYRKDPRSMITPNAAVTQQSVGTSNPYVYDYSQTLTPMTRGIFDLPAKMKEISGILRLESGFISSTTAPNVFGYANQYQPSFRGGAADLFYYGTLPSLPKLISGYSIEDTPLDSIFNGDYKERYHYLGGSETLGEFFDQTYNKEQNTNRGTVSWVAPDVFYDMGDFNLSDEQRDSVFTERNLLRSLIRPYAKLFYIDDVTTRFSDSESSQREKVTYTISAEDLKRYIVDGDLLKSSSDNRPMWGDGNYYLNGDSSQGRDTSKFTRVVHGTHTTPIDSDGNFDYSVDPLEGYKLAYSDTAQPSYLDLQNSFGEPDIDYTIVLGFVATNVLGVDLNVGGFAVDDSVRENQFIQTDDNGNEYTLSMRATSAVLESSKKNKRFESPYPYSPIRNFCLPVDIEGQNEYAHKFGTIHSRLGCSFPNIGQSVNPIKFTLATRNVSNRKFNNKFHKVAVFKYDNSILNEVQKDYFLKSKNPQDGLPKEKFVDTIGRDKFGLSPFVPIPLGLKTISPELNRSPIGKAVLVKLRQNSMPDVKLFSGEVNDCVKTGSSFYTTNARYNDTAAVVLYQAHPDFFPEGFSYQPGDYIKVGQVILTVSSVDVGAFGLWEIEIYPPNTNTLTRHFIKPVVDEGTSFEYWGVGEVPSLPALSEKTTTKNPIIRFGNSSASSENSDRGRFSKSVQIINSENLQYEDTSYYEHNGVLKYNSPTSGNPIGRSSFQVSNMMGGFDIEKPDFVPLYIQSTPMSDSSIPLRLNSTAFDSDSIDFYIESLGVSNTFMNLKVGPATADFSTSFIVRNYECLNSLRLNIDGHRFNTDADLYMRGPGATDDLTLTFAPPFSGSTPLNIRGPLPKTESLNLFLRPSGTDFAQTELFTKAIGAETGNPLLFVSGLGVKNSQMTLSFPPPASSGTTLIINPPGIVSTGSMPLNIEGYGVQSALAPLFIGSRFRLINTTKTLFIKPERYSSGNITALIEGDIYTANSIYDNAHGVYRGLIRPQGGLRDETRLFVDSTNPYAFETGDGLPSVFLVPPNGDVPIPPHYSMGHVVRRSNSLVFTGFFDQEFFRDPKKHMPISRNSRDGHWFFGSLIRRTHTFNSKDYTVDPAVAVLEAANDNNSGNAFYKVDYGNDVSRRNSFIKQDAYDANGKFLVNAAMFNNDIQIGIYPTIVDSLNGISPQIESKGEEGHLFFNPCLRYADSNLLHDGIIDPFINLRKSIYEIFKDKYSQYEYGDIDLDNSQSNIKDLKISKGGNCALSFRMRVGYNKTSTGVDHNSIFNVVLVFNVNMFTSCSVGFTDDSAFSWYIQEEYGHGIMKQSIAHNLSFDDEDLYFDRRRGDFGEIWKLSKDGYSQASKVIGFSDLADYNHYKKNRASIGEARYRVGFGVPLKIFDVDKFSGSKIMCIGATLFDPFVMNTLTQTHIPNAIGAVYIFKKDANTSWSYFGAVYGKGYTSDNILSNLSDYRSGTLGNDQYSLFGYDFDYNGGNLVVSEPGGNGPQDVNAGRAYLFEIDGSSPSLKETYLSSNITLPSNENATSISAGDNFGSSIVLAGPDDPITWSDATLSKRVDYADTSIQRMHGDSSLYNLRNNSVFGFSFETDRNGVTSMQKDHLVKNWSPYSIDQEGWRNFASIDNNIYMQLEEYLMGIEGSLGSNSMWGWGGAVRRDTYRSTRIVSMKMLNIGTARVLAVVREFEQRARPNAHDEYVGHDFRMQKLSIFDLQKQAGSDTLFIAGPTSVSDNMSVFSSGIGGSTNNMSLVTPPMEISSGLMPLHVEQADRHLLTLHIGDLYKPSIPLVFKDVAYQRGDPLHSDATLMMTNPIANPFNNETTLKTGGSLHSGVVGAMPFYIGQTIDANTKLPFKIDGIIGGMDLDDHSRSFDVFNTNANLSISGSLYAGFDAGTTMSIQPPLMGSGNASHDLYITTDIPPTGDSGLYVDSDNIGTFIQGDNDANIYLPEFKDSSLFVYSSVVDSEETTLFIRRDITDARTLFLRAQKFTETIPIHISGLFMSTGNLDLVVQGPPNTGMSLFTFGFRE